MGNLTLSAEFLNLATLSHLFVDENAARTFIESKVWPDGPACPHCECETVYKLTPRAGSKSPVRPGVYKCKDCRKQFTVRIGTIFEDSKIPFTKWLMTIHLMTSSKKGVSSLQISRELGITVKSAWFMTHRIREAMRMPDDEPRLNVVVEADKACIGGNPRYKGPSKRGRGTNKSPVAFLMESAGDVRVQNTDNVTKDTLTDNVLINVVPVVNIHTDEFDSYLGIASAFPGDSRMVNDLPKIYVNIDGEHVRAAESFSALLKRGHYGIFHHLSKKHLHRYCSEFEFRWNHRKVTDGERMVAAIRGVVGKRLFYVQPHEPNKQESQACHNERLRLGR
jgi:transposase-like protein